MSSGLRAQSPKTVCCTMRNAALGRHPWYNTGVHGTRDSLGTLCPEKPSQFCTLLRHFWDLWLFLALVQGSTTVHSAGPRDVCIDHLTFTSSWLSVGLQPMGVYWRVSGHASITLTSTRRMGHVCVHGMHVACRAFLRTVIGFLIAPCGPGLVLVCCQKFTLGMIAWLARIACSNTT